MAEGGIAAFLHNTHSSNGVSKELRASRCVERQRGIASEIGRLG
jgi:hypothetical protein